MKIVYCAFILLIMLPVTQFRVAEPDQFPDPNQDQQEILQYIAQELILIIQALQELSDQDLYDTYDDDIDTTLDSNKKHSLKRLTSLFRTP